MQRHRCCANIPMNVFVIMNVIIVYRRKCYVNISMNTLPRVNVTTMQRCKRCTFDSPGLASESEVYPGLFAVRGNNAVSVVIGILSKHSTQKTCNTYGVDLFTTHITQGRLRPTLGYHRYNAFSVELQMHYDSRYFMR